MDEYISMHAIHARANPRGHKALISRTVLDKAAHQTSMADAPNYHEMGVSPFLLV